MEAKNHLELANYATKEIALSQKPIAELLKEHEGVVIQYSKTTVKKNLNALVKKHQKEIAELIALEQLTVKQETRLTELRKLYKDSRIALGKITTHNSSVLAAASKHSKEIKDELVLIVSPVEVKITERLDAEEARREKARKDKEDLEEKRKEKISDWIDAKKKELQAIIDKTKTFESIEDNKTEYLNTVKETRTLLDNKEFDLQEFQVVFDTMLTDKAEELQTVITNLNTANQLEVQNRALEVSKLTNERMVELFDYNFKYKGEVELGELDEEEYAEVMIPERTKFRISQLEELGFTKSASEDNKYQYIPAGKDIILLSTELDYSVKPFNNEDWDAFLKIFQEEIEAYNAPAPAVVEEVVAVAEEVKEEEKPAEEAPKRMFGTDSANPAQDKIVYKVQLQDEIKVVPDPIEFEALNSTPVQQLIDLLISRGFTEGFIEDTMHPVLQQEREALIDFYNAGQTDTINILITEIEKEAPELMEGMKEQFAGNINKLDAIEHFNNTFPN